MIGTQVLVDQLHGRSAAALMRDGRLDDLLVDPPETMARPGAIYRARMGRPMKGMGGRMVSLPHGSGYIRQAKNLAPGATVLVQVTGYAEPGKAVPVTPRILFKSRFCIVTPDKPGANLSRSIKDEDSRAALQALLSDIDMPDGLGVIIRSAAEGASEVAVTEDLTRTLALAQAVIADPGGAPELLLDGPTPDLLAWRDWAGRDDSEVITTAGCFATHGVLDAIDALVRPDEALPGGGHMFVEATRALVAVDVNTGADTSPAAGLKTNIAAARALPRALRLRGLGGQIVLDVAPMAKKDRTVFEQALGAALRACPVETTIIGWTPLGHIELSRKRERLPLTRTLP
jgi:Ribonuclease G/E